MEIRAGTCLPPLETGRRAVNEGFHRRAGPVGLSDG
jgi:hypothetical protein